MTASAEEQKAVMVEFARIAGIGGCLSNPTVKEYLATGKAVDRYETKALVSLLCYANGEAFVDPEDEDSTPAFVITIDGDKWAASYFTASTIVNGGVLEGFEFEGGAVKFDKLTFKVYDSDFEYESDEVVISDAKIECGEGGSFSLVSFKLGNENHRISHKNDESFYFDDYLMPSK